MFPRALYPIAFSATWGRQMRMVVGPRQVGKTTLAKKKLAEEHSRSLYYLWDLREVRRRYRENELFFAADVPPDNKAPWVCFDEVHKMPRWKNILKGIFDETGDRFHFIVTGSAKLNLVRRAGDSLAGRYSAFHLMPLTLPEAAGGTMLATSADDWLTEATAQKAAPEETLAALLRFGGFPEPFSRGSTVFHRKWSRDYADAVVREDIGTLTRIVEREHLVDLFDLLPGFVGSPLSYASLASHLEISPITVKSYLGRLQDFYLAFPLHPYTRNVKRSLLKAPKFYLYDWSRVENEAARFENYVACELMARTLLWTDITGEPHRLWYIRTKDRQETDFLVTRAQAPLFLVEAKLSDIPIEGHHLNHADALGRIVIFQVCAKSGVNVMQRRNAFRISVDRLLAR